VVPLLKRADVARMLNKPVSWVRWAQQRGILSYVRVGQQVRFRADEIAAWIETNTIPARKEGDGNFHGREHAPRGPG
jgi:hypothetical protein